MFTSIASEWTDGTAEAQLAEPCDILRVPRQMAALMRAGYEVPRAQNSGISIPMQNDFFSFTRTKAGCHAGGPQFGNVALRHTLT